MTPPPAPRRLLLVGWDAVDWSTARPLLRAGVLPNLARLIAGGASGDLATLYPVIAPIVWTSALTGVTADRHGIFGYADAPDTGDGPARLVTPADRRVPVLWDFVARRGGRSHCVNWPCSYPAYPVGGWYVSDRVTQGLAVDDLDNAPVLPPGWISAPDRDSGDEGAALRMVAGEVEPSVLSRFLSGPGPVPSWLAPALAACFTVHNYATSALEAADGWELAAFRYPGLLPLALARARGGSDSAGDEAAIEGFYRLHDAFLGRLLQLANRPPVDSKSTEPPKPPMVMLLSGHGFPARMVGGETDTRTGLLVVSGADGQKVGTLLTGATLLDIAPTALRLLGFAPTVAADAGLTGRVLPIARRNEPSELSSVASVTSDAPTTATPRAEPWREATLTTNAAAAALPALAHEGLLPLSQACGDRNAARSLALSRLWTHARVLAHDGQYANVLPLLQSLYAERPADGDVAILLADALQETGRRGEAIAVVTDLQARCAVSFPEIDARCRFFFAEDALAQGKRGEALRHLTEASELTTSSALLLGIGRALYRLRRFDRADACFIRVLDTDPTEPAAWMGRAGMAILTRQPEAAIAYAQEAIQRRHDVPLPHLILARALRLTGRPREARAAYATALRLGIHVQRSAKDALDG